MTCRSENVIKQEIKEKIKVRLEQKQELQKHLLHFYDLLEEILDIAFDNFCNEIIITYNVDKTIDSLQLPIWRDASIQYIIYCPNSMEASEDGIRSHKTSHLNEQAAIEVISEELKMNFVQFTKFIRNGESRDDHEHLAYDKNNKIILRLHTSVVGD